MGADFDLVAFDPGDPKQAAFVYDSFRRSTCGLAPDHPEYLQARGCWPWNELRPRVVMDQFKRELARPGTVAKVITPLRMPGSFIGWAAVRAPGTIVYAFVKHRSRRMSVGASACIEMGVDFLAGPVGLVFWTPAAARLHVRHDGFNLFFDTTGGFDEADQAAKDHVPAHHAGPRVG